MQGIEIEFDSAYYLYQAGLKIKKEKEELKSKKVYSNLGAMFAVDQKTSSTESSSNSDEDFDIHHAKNDMVTRILVLHTCTEIYGYLI